jgi:hypothetical protein
VFIDDRGAVDPRSAGGLTIPSAHYRRTASNLRSKQCSFMTDDSARRTKAKGLSYTNGYKVAQ